MNMLNRVAMTVQVEYWMRTCLKEETGLEQGSTVHITMEDVDKLLEKGFKVMFDGATDKTKITMWIDTKRFTQR